MQEAGKHYLNNHLHFTILYHKDAQTDLARIVGFEVEPYSVHHTFEGARAGLQGRCGGSGWLVDGAGRLERQAATRRQATGISHNAQPARVR